MFDLKSSKPDELLPNLLDQIPVEEVDLTNQKKRESDRHKQLFTIYQPLDEVNI